MTIAKVIEIVASSDKSFDDAVEQGLAKAGETVRGISGVEVKDFTGDVQDDKIVRYKVTMNIAFRVDAK